MFMMGIIKNCCFISFCWIICRVEFQRVETSCIKDSDFWLTLLCSVWSSTSFAGLCLKWPAIGFSDSIKFGVLYWLCLFFQLHQCWLMLRRLAIGRFHQLIPSTKCVFATQMICKRRRTAMILNSHLHMLQTTTEFDLKVNLPPKINLPVLLVAIFSSAKQEVIVNKKEVEGHKTKTNTNFWWKYL